MRVRGQVLLLSCAAYAGTVVLQVLLRGESTVEGWQLLTAASWALAILLDFLVGSWRSGCVRSGISASSKRTA
jgi:hypothetical protein